MLPEKIYFNIEEDPYGFTLTFPDFDFTPCKLYKSQTNFYMEARSYLKHILHNHEVFNKILPDFNYKSLYSISTKKLEKDTEFYYEEECKSENILQNILKLSASKIIKMKADDNGIFHPTI